MTRPRILDDDVQQYWSLVQRIERLEQTVLPGPWIPFPFAAGWDDGNTVFPGFDSAEYRRIGQQVFLRGLVTKTSGLPAPVQVMGTLPDGFKPISRSIFACAGGGDGPTHPQQMIRVDVDINGDVSWVGSPFVPIETDFVGLNNVIFWTD